MLNLQSSDHERGFSLIEALILVGALGAGGLLMLKTSDRATHRQHAVKTRADLASLATRLQTETNCDTSLAPYLSSLNTLCVAPLSPTPIPLKAKSGANILDVGATLGKYQVNAYCETFVDSMGTTKRGISVYATIPDPTKPGQFQKELLNGQPFDRNHAGSHILKPSKGLCSEALNGTSYNCGVGGLVSEVKADGSVVCASNASVCAQLGGAWNAAKGRCFLPVTGGNCSPTQVLAGYNANGQPICVKPATKLNLYNVKKMGPSGGGGTSKTTVCCDGNDKMLACAGAREKNVDDTCKEEVCGYIGAVISGNCCTAGADTDAGTEPVADGLCVKQ